MNENAQVTEMILSGKEEGGLALATVIKVQGSAYRKEGAKMLMNKSGIMTGMISGGCLEPDVQETAKMVTESGEPVCKRYEMDEDLVWGLGLGCPGTVDILIEPVAAPAGVSAAFRTWMDIVEKEGAAVLCTVTTGAPGLQMGERICVAENSSFEVGYTVTGVFGNSELQEEVIARAAALLRIRHPKCVSETVCLPGGSEVNMFFDIQVPPPELLIFGAGHDAVPLGKKSVETGFKTKVVDPRPAYNSEERFPGGECIVIDPSFLMKTPEITQRTYVVIMNHHMERDVKALEAAVKSEAPYVGVLGPASRLERMLNSLKERGIMFSDEELAKVHGPVGLDLGADSAEEIALSIMAEVLAVKNGHSARFLKERKVIHQPVRQV